MIHTTESSEAVLEGTWVIPESGAPVFVIQAVRRSTTTDKDNSNDHENDSCRKLEKRSPELFFGVSKSTKDVDDDDDNEEDLEMLLVQVEFHLSMATHTNPDGDIAGGSPVLNDSTADCQFQRQDESPLHDIVPTHGETPGRINESVGVPKHLLVLLVILYICHG